MLQKMLYFNPRYDTWCGFMHSVICTWLCLFLVLALLWSVHALLALALISAVLVEGQQGENLHNTIWQEQLSVSPQGSHAHSPAPELYVWINPFPELRLALGQMEAQRSWSWKVPLSRMTKTTQGCWMYQIRTLLHAVTFIFSEDWTSSSFRFCSWRHPKPVFLFPYNTWGENGVMSYKLEVHYFPTTSCPKVFHSFYTIFCKLQTFFLIY